MPTSGQTESQVEEQPGHALPKVRRASPVFLGPSSDLDRAVGAGCPKLKPLEKAMAF
jgi:hypothetical protein